MTYDDMPLPARPPRDPDARRARERRPMLYQGSGGAARLTVRTPTDALALAPLVLGFHPEESVVLMTFGGDGFHARVDLPRDDLGRDDVVDLLVRALQTNPCTIVMVLFYSADEQACGALSARLLPALTEELGLDVADVVRADGAHWWSMRPGRDVLGVPYDVTTHPFTADAVLRGTVVHRDRDAIAEMLGGEDADFVHQVEQALEGRPIAAPPPVGPARRQLASWLRRTVETWVSNGALGPPEEVAHVLTLVEEPDLRDVVWGAMDRTSAAQHLSTWIHVLRASPAAWEASPAAVVALCAWLHGDGALAWTAVERSLDADPHNSLAVLVAEALDRAIPPTSWQPWTVEELLARHG